MKHESYALLGLPLAIGGTSKAVSHEPCLLVKSKSMTMQGEVVQGLNFPPCRTWERGLLHDKASTGP